MNRRNRLWLLVWTTSVALLGGIALAGNEGQEDLDKATRAKLNAKTLSDLAEVVRLCEAAMTKGLDDENSKFAKTLLASALSQRGVQHSKDIFESVPRDPNWAESRRVALEDLEKAVKLDPELAEAHFHIAQLNLLPRGNAKRVEQALDQAIRYSKEDPSLQAQALALRSEIQKDPQKKLADLNEALRVAPGEAVILRARSAAHAQVEKFAEAMADLEAALKLDPKHAPTIEAKAILLAKMKKFDAALAVLDELRKLDPKSPSPWACRAQVHILKADLPEAVKDLTEAIRLDPNDVDSLLLRAAVYWELKENDRALAEVDKVLAQRPNYEKALRFRVTLLAGEGKFKEAISQVEDLLKAKPDDSENRLRLAMLYTEDKKLDKAIRIYGEMIAKNASDWMALRGRGDALLSLGKHAEAVADYEKAHKLRPDDSGILNNYSWVLSTSPFDKVRNGKRALELAKEACRLTDYKQGHILSTLAAAHAELGDFKSAIEWSKKAVALGRPDQKEDLAKELKTYEAGKPMRELKTAETADKPPAESPKKAEPAKPTTPEKPKTAEKTPAEKAKAAAPKK